MKHLIYSAIIFFFFPKKKISAKMHKGWNFDASDALPLLLVYQFWSSLYLIHLFLCTFYYVVHRRIWCFNTSLLCFFLRGSDDWGSTALPSQAPWRGGKIDVLWRKKTTIQNQGPKLSSRFKRVSNIFLSRTRFAEFPKS